MATPWNSSSSTSSLWAALGQASSVAQLVGVDALGLVSMVDCGYLRRLLLGGHMADELRAAQNEIDMFIRLIPLIALVDNSTNSRRAKVEEGVLSVVTDSSNHHIRFPARDLEFTKICIQGATELRNVQEQPFVGKVDLQEQKISNVEELMELCAHIEATCMGFSKFNFFQIMDGTGNFSEKAIIGRGGFATVYKEPLQCELSDGVTVAIKRAHECATVGSELQLAKLQHTNLIRLLGWCIHEKERILVYEFMHNGSLDGHIYDRTKGSLLDWSKRLKIIKGLIEGLVYMHKGSMLWIVNRDLKPNNILLDYNLNPRIADFGSARALSSEVAEEHTNMVVGTCGYKAPEYASRGVYSVKTDVFSFGVLVLAIITGRKNTILDRRGDTVGDLVRDAWHMWKDKILHELVDPSLGNRYEIAEITRCAHMALLCAQEDPADRSTMTDVAAMLNSESMSLSMEPKQPTVLSKGSDGESTASTYMGQSSRTIDITITSSAPMSTRVRIILDPECSCAN
ncbi:unnamed protein product [Triticum turgidum subsp. durum]|uniref:Protein kinase domain-containing protein n=1 Tax=Triticum turgidum subsp. durum TaxID=4567 RepID=A0A9R1AAZ5_TRITD|nr:unnamed protein product [Triticum turgidum subsp. durum]